MPPKSNVTALADAGRKPARIDRSGNPRQRKSPVRRREPSPIECSLMQLLRAGGGRLWMVDLVFELRCRGAGAEAVQRELGELVERGLVRPLTQRRYELTTRGWDLSRAL